MSKTLAEEDGYEINDDVKRIAREFHETYEEVARARGWKTQRKTQVPFHQLPEENRETMLVTVGSLLTRGVIQSGDGGLSIDEKLKPLAPAIAVIERVQAAGLDDGNLAILLPPDMLEPFTEVYGIPLLRIQGITDPMVVWPRPVRSE